MANEIIFKRQTEALIRMIKLVILIHVYHRITYYSATEIIRPNKKLIIRIIKLPNRLTGLYQAYILQSSELEICDQMKQSKIVSKNLIQKNCEYI